MHVKNRERDNNTERRGVNIYKDWLRVNRRENLWKLREGERERWNGKACYLNFDQINKA